MLDGAFLGNAVLGDVREQFAAEQESAQASRRHARQAQGRILSHGRRATRKVNYLLIDF